MDPVAKTITQLSTAWDMFCNGMTVLADGRVMIDGGTISYDPFHGNQKASLFDPATNTFTDVQSMAHGRWYPTVTLLSDGRVMTFSGQDENGAHEHRRWKSIPWVRDGVPLLTPSGHHRCIPGCIFCPTARSLYSGPSATTYYFNPIEQELEHRGQYETMAPHGPMAVRSCCL